MQHEKLEKGIYFGMLGNLLFIAFGFLAYIYYLTYNSDSFFSNVLEAVAYITEFSAFGILAYSDFLLWTSVRLRNLMKFSYTAYILLEAVMMILEITAAGMDMYQPYSLPLAIVHAVVSGFACFAFLQLDPDNTKFEKLTVVCISIIFAGMLGNILGIRVYFSIIVNAVGFSLFFAGIRYFMNREEIEIDCYGDRADVGDYNSSTLFSDPDIDFLGTRTEKKEEPEEAKTPEEESKAEEPEAETPKEEPKTGGEKKKRKKSNFI